MKNLTTTICLTIVVLLGSVGVCDGQGVVGSTPSILSYDGAVPVVNSAINIPAHSARIARKLGLQPIRFQVPSYDGKGLLAVSWTPTESPFESPTYVIMHGGHGIGGTSWYLAKELKGRLNANVLILDSFWSRGKKRHRERGAGIDAIVRTFDVIAAGRWLKDQGTDPKKTYMMGGSQGGWTTLKAMTAEPVQIAEVKPLYAGGVAYFPVCDNYNTDGNLRSGQRYVDLADGGYWGPVLLLTGDKDFATDIDECPKKVVESATKHIRYARGTHGWNARWWDKKENDWNKPGSCSVGDKFTMCYDVEHTNDMYNQIGKFTKGDLRRIK